MLYVNYRELKSLPEEAHWFCFRNLEDEKKESEATEDEEKERYEASNQRVQLALDALQILAFDGDDATTWQLWLKERLKTYLTSCDGCIRNYHCGKKQMKQNLEE